MREPSSKAPCIQMATEDATMRMRIGRLVALAAMVFGFATVAWAAGPEVDPGSVSDGLKAIFKYGKGQRETADRLNTNTVTLMSGTIGGTYVQFGADLASALDDGDNLRVLSIVGRGSVQSVADILFLKGVDLGIVRSDTLDYLEKKGYANNIKKQFTYITKLYNEEMHVVAPKTIQSLNDLEGKTVAVDLPNGGTFVTSAIVFERLVARFSQIDGYRCLSLTRALEVVKCQSALVWWALRSCSQAAISSMRDCLSGMR